MNTGFADRRVSHFAIGASGELKKKAHQAGGLGWAACIANENADLLSDPPVYSRESSGKDSGWTRSSWNMPATSYAGMGAGWLHCGYPEHTWEVRAVSSGVVRSLEYAQVDVFAERALEGNALAVFADGRGLSTGEMQAIARETNLSETTFILPRDAAVERERGVQVRIFTVEEELRFAGHPTLGTASWLHWHHPVLRGAGEIVLELAVGPIPVRFRADVGSPGVFATMRQNDPFFGMEHEREAVSEALGLSLDDLDPMYPVQTVSTGTAFCIVPLRSVQAMERMRVQLAKQRACLAGSGARWFYCITPDSGGGADWRARMQFSGGDDPATGSAAGCAIAYLVRHELAASEEPIVIAQGLEIQRPSRIHVQAVREGTAVSEVRVGGRTIPVAAGLLILP